jgi:hypothetical protein
VDIGAHEFQDPCPADMVPSTPGVPGDNQVTVADLFEVIDAWGPCDGCIGDVNGSGEVDIDDLFIVVAGWGACS